MGKPKILTFVPYYLPGYKSGGPIRTIANMVEHMGDEFQFCIVTSDRDAGDEKPYESIRPDTWTEVGEAKVYYSSPSGRSLRALRALIYNTPHDVQYFNSFFYPDYTIKPLLLRKLSLVPDRPVVLAPRGEFSKGALQLKWMKKYSYVVGARLTGLYEGITWQASSKYEAEDIRRVMGGGVDLQVAQDLPPSPKKSSALKHWGKKEKGKLRAIFVSKIVKKKNLKYAIDVIKSVKKNVSFTIVGPTKDEKYWGECLRKIEDKPENINVEYKGSVEHERVYDLMAAHDLFFLPTKGENYGHVIQEALSVGTPVLISDQTPWRDLQEKGVGWDLPLRNMEAFGDAIEKCAEMGSREYFTWRKKVETWARKQQRDPESVEQNRELFQSVL